MTYSAFMYSLRLLVLCGLCFTSWVGAATRYTLGDGFSYSSAVETCQAWVAKYPISSGDSYGTYSLTGYSETKCFMKRVQKVSPFNVSYFNNEPIIRSCVSGVSGSITDTYDVVNSDQTGSTTKTAPYPSNPPASQCYQGCTQTNNGTQSVSFSPVINWSISSFVTYPIVQTSEQCGMPPPPKCDLPLVSFGEQCVVPPTCTSPAVYQSSSNSCVVPACGSGLTRITPTASCSPIECVAPMVKVGNSCQIPSCTSGSSYEYKNGSGQCVKDLIPCSPPQTMINGSCQVPVCAAGTAINANGMCVLSAGTSSTSSTNAEKPPTTTTTSTSSTTTTNTPTGSTASTTSTSTTSGGGSTGGGTGGTGTCTTPPCGACDPAVTTCGNTFGGSCSSDFKCTGDAVQCAVATATNKSECLMQAFKVDTEKDVAYSEGKTAFDAGTKGLGKDGGIQVANGSNITINSDNPYSSSCPADQPLFEYKGAHVTIPLSKYCNIFQIMGNIMLLAASLIALKIIMKVD